MMASFTKEYPFRETGQNQTDKDISKSSFPPNLPALVDLSADLSRRLVRAGFSIAAIKILRPQAALRGVK
jgi:hypothetical protein